MGLGLGVQGSLAFVRGSVSSHLLLEGCCEDAVEHLFCLHKTSCFSLLRSCYLGYSKRS